MDKHLVEKSNILNNFKCKPKEQMTLNELRFFCLFVSRLNPLDREKRTVDIKISDFENLFDVKINTTEFNQTLSHILSRTMYVYKADIKKHSLINLYSKFEWEDGFENNIISISANYDIVPFLWDLKGNYTSYKLINIAKLNSVSKIRLYEILTQYKNKKNFSIEIDDLKELIQSKQKQFKDFNKFVLKPAIKDINEYTDITVKYEKVLKCRKCIAINFSIENKNKEILEEQEIKQIENSEPIKVSAPEPEKKNLNKCFGKEQEEFFKNNIRNALQSVYKTDDMINSRTEAIYSKCMINFNMKQQTGTLKNPAAYMSGIITNAVSSEIDKPMKEKNRSYNLGDFEKMAINYKEIEEIEQSDEKLEFVEKEKCYCTQSETVVSHFEADKTVTPIKDENTLNQTEMSDTEDIMMQAEADLCLKAAEAVKIATDYESAIKTLDIFIPDWRNFDGFFADQIKDELAKKFK